MNPVWHLGGARPSLQAVVIRSPFRMRAGKSSVHHGLPDSAPEGAKLPGRDKEVSRAHLPLEQVSRIVDTHHSQYVNFRSDQ